MSESEEEQQRKLDKRRELLRQRKGLKKQQELEQRKIQDQMTLMQMEDDEKSRIGKEYLFDLFQKSTSGNNTVDDDKSKQQQRLMAFNEFTSDALL